MREKRIIYCSSFYSMSGLFRYLHVWTPQNTPSKTFTGKKIGRSELSHLLCKTGNSRLLTILFPGETGWWDATRLTYQAYQAPFNYCQLRGVIWAINTWWHWKEMPNNCSIWNKTLSANSKTQMTFTQICPIALCNYKDCILSLAMQTRSWVENNILANDCIYPSGLVHA